jgi:exosortase F-associated protein
VIQSKTLRILAAAACTTGLLMVFTFQRTDIASIFGIEGRTLNYIVNRSLRFLLNDVFMLGIIYALFRERKYILFAIAVQALGVVLILIPYLVLKINYSSEMRYLLSFLHRLIVNPILLVLLIPAFYYQRMIEPKMK